MCCNSVIQASQPNLCNLTIVGIEEHPRRRFIYLQDFYVAFLLQKGPFLERTRLYSTPYDFDRGLD